jgi:hypothetical protein
MNPRVGERKAALASIVFSEEGSTLLAIDSEDIEFLFGGVPRRLAA